MAVAEVLVGGLVGLSLVIVLLRGGDGRPEHRPPLEVQVDIVLQAYRIAQVHPCGQDHAAPAPESRSLYGGIDSGAVHGDPVSGGAVVPDVEYMV